MTLRKHAEWMELVDDRILEYLSEHDSGRPTDIHQSLAAYGDAMTYSQRYIDQRLDLLSSVDVVEKHPDRWEYRLTQRGQLYLRGEFTVDSLSTPPTSGHDSVIDRIE